MQCVNRLCNAASALPAHGRLLKKKETPGLLGPCQTQVSAEQPYRIRLGSRAVRRGFGGNRKEQGADQEVQGIPWLCVGEPGGRRHVPCRPGGECTGPGEVCSQPAGQGELLPVEGGGGGADLTNPVLALQNLVSPDRWPPMAGHTGSTVPHRTPTAPWPPSLHSPGTPPSSPQGAGAAASLLAAAEASEPAGPCRRRSLWV